VKKSVIVGVTGQGGSYLAGLLLEKGYEVHGTSRDPARASFTAPRGERASIHQTAEPFVILFDGGDATGSPVSCR